ncbi:MAG: PKD domain-containing protein, partial [Dehalococcoidia bacterium]
MTCLFGGVFAVTEESTGNPGNQMMTSSMFNDTVQLNAHDQNITSHMLTMNDISSEVGSVLPDTSDPRTRDGLTFFPETIQENVNNSVQSTDLVGTVSTTGNETYVFVTKWGSDNQGDGQFYYPEGIAIDSSGNIYIVERENNRIQKFSSTGMFLAKWGSYGTGDGQFDRPREVAVDSSGNIYLTDRYNNRIQKFSSNGTFLAKWGSMGSGDGQFCVPGDVAVDSSGDVYVADWGNDRIQKFSSNGTFLAKWGSYGSGNGQFNNANSIAIDSSGNIYVAEEVNARIQKFSSTGTFLAKWGTLGTSDGQFWDPYGVVVDLSGNVYVADSGNHRIQKFSSTGTFLAKWGTKGISDGEFFLPNGVAIDSSGNVYVVDMDNHRIQKFSSTGAFLEKWGGYNGDGQFNNPYGVAVDSSGDVFVADSDNRRIQKFSSNGTFLAKWGSYGTGDYQFNHPEGVAVDSSGNVYVTDSGNHRIQKFSSTGTFLAKWGTEGSGDGQFQRPLGVAVDSLDNIYVGDTWNNRIQKFSSTGTFLAKWGTEGSGDGQFQRPLGVAVDSLDNIYVVDEKNNRIQKFSSTGIFSAKWGTEGSGNGQFSNPWGVIVDSSDNIYVADSGNHRIQKFSSTGAFLAKWGSYGTGDGLFDYPRGVAIDPSGDVYVTDSNNYRLQKFAQETLLAANFSANVTSGTAPLTVQFTDLSTGSPTSWNWSFGDGVLSNVKNPVHIYHTAGNYSVSLNATNTKGSSIKTKSGYIIVNSGSPSYPKVTRIPNFTDLGHPYSLVTDGVYIYYCRNQNDREDISRIPIEGGNVEQLYTYLNQTGEGANPLSLTIIGNDLFWIDPNSGPVTDTQILKAPKNGSGPITSIYTGSLVGQPIADGSGVTTNGTTLFVVDEVKGRVYRMNPDGTDITKIGEDRYTGYFDTEHFNSIIHDDGILYVADSGMVGVIEPQAVSIPVINSSIFTPLHVGSPLIQPKGITSGNRTLFVTDPGAGNTIWSIPITGGNPNALLSGTPFIDIRGLTFFNNAIYVADYGGSTDPGSIYKVELSSSGGLLEASFEANITHGTAPLAVQFTDRSTGSPTAWNWSFGDGSLSALQHPAHTYTTTGSYTVSLNATNAAGSNVSIRANYITVTGSQAPVANFTTNVTTGKAPLAIQFTDTSTNNPTGWAWFFGDESYTAPWTQVNASAGWSARSRQSSVVMPDGSIVLMGGNADGNKKNDVWRSFDDGVTWTQMTASAEWSTRDGQSSVVMPDGSIVLMGGTVYGDKMNDVWRSTDSGTTWIQMTASAEWSARDLHSCVAMPDGSIILMGGYDRSYNIKNDVWRSSDYGATWTRVNASAGWSARYGSTSVAMLDGNIILMGGFGGSYKNDVWQSTDNGTTWTQVTESAGWSARYGSTSVAMPDGSIILMGGRDNFVGANNDVWQSIDNGAIWTQVTGSPGWSVRYGHSSVVMPDGSIVLIGGGTNDVWRFMPAGSSEQNPLHTFTMPGIYSVALQAYNIGGYNNTRKTGYITVTGSPAPVANFTANVTSGAAPLSVVFSDLSSNNPTGWAWYFSDENFTAPWTQLNSNAGWSVRFYHSSVAMPDGSIILMGGLDNNYNIYKNDTWRSMDKGATWTQVNGSSGWSARYAHSSIVMQDGSIVLMGGLDNYGNNKNDTWRSMDKGATWTRVNASAGWSARYMHTSVVMPDGSIILMGGYDRTYRFMNDVWRSTDYGATWTRVNASAGWSARYGSTSVAMPDSSVVLMGGYDSGTRLMNDVWRSTDNGVTWIQVNASAGWYRRYAHSSVAMPDGSIVLTGGFDGINSYLINDVWRSTDNGVTWIQVNASAGWSARYAHSSVAMPDGSLVLMGGDDGGYGHMNMKNDVWRFMPAGSLEQNPSHTFSKPGIYQVVLLANNAGGYNSTRKTGYITVIPPPVANFTANITVGTAPLTVQFTDYSTNLPTVWNWSFGDNTWFNTTTAEARNVTHIYTSAGLYTVNLTATNVGGSNVSVRMNYIVVKVSKPFTDFSANITSGKAPLPISFTDLSSNTSTGWAWYFGDENFTAPWTRVNTSAGWTARYMHSSVAMPDGSI